MEWNVMAVKGFEELRVYQMAEHLSDEVWEMVCKWDVFAKDTVGKQIVRSVDSVGAKFRRAMAAGLTTTIGGSCERLAVRSMRRDIG